MKNRTKTFLFCLVFLPVAELLAQSNLNNLGFPSPNNSFLNAVGGTSGVGVNLYSGAAQVNIPICELSSRVLNVPVSLQYTAGRGVKVQDFATSVGLGWQLSAGGSISRVVRGFPDEFPNGYLGTIRYGQRIKQNLADGVGLSAADYKAITGWDNTSYVGITADGEPDIYYLRTPAFNLQFTFDENGNAVFNNETGVKITSSGFYNNSIYNNSTFTVTDPTGNTYTFGTWDQEREKTVTTLHGSSYTFNTTWYLSRITSFNAKDYVSFGYISSPNNDVLNHYQWTRTYYHTGCVDNTSDPIPMTVIQPRYLAVIGCETGHIYLNYAFDRRDITTAARLTSVLLQSTGSMGPTDLKTFGFNYSYFGDPTNDVNLLRLKLDNITMAGGTVATSTPLPYRSFTYNTNQHLPERNSQNFDYWGYYKSISGDPMADPTLRSANESNSKADILTNIAELGGSTWTINYESNTYFKATPRSNVPVGGLRVSSISKSLSAGDVIQTQYIYNDAIGYSTGQIQTEAYQFLVVNAIDDDNCQLLAEKVLSEAPVNIYDLNGTFVGYSAVKTVQQNGGYTVCNFLNFSDFGDVFSTGMLCGETNVPTLTSSISFAHKRGLLKSTIVYTAANEKITEEINSYTSLSNPVTKSGWAYRAYVASASCGGNWSLRSLSSIYYTNIENYRLSGVVRREYDQLTPANYIETATNFSYCANKRTVQSVSTTDSKGNTATKTVYHAHDAGIPMITSAEQTVVNTLQSMNNLDAPVHETANRNGAIRQTHYTYSYPYQGSTAPCLTSAANYKGSTLLTTKEMKYEANNVNLVNLVATKETGGKSTSVLYGYNNTFPVATVSNADVFQQVSQGRAEFGGTVVSTFTVTVTTDYTNALIWNINLMGPLTSTINWTWTITGSANMSGSRCMGPSGSGCPTSITHGVGLPAGTYTLTLTTTSSPGFNFYITGNYPKNIPFMTKEYYYEGFEDINLGVAGSAHTGNRYRNAGSFAVPFTPPNNRNYVMQWWTWVSGKWLFNEAPYTGPTTINGIVDDIRVFPADAQMSTYTYDPQVGKTGEIDPSGRTTTYEFDGLGRMNVVRDNDKNIVSKNCYNIAGQPEACPVPTVYSNIARSQSFTRNNCASGYLGGQVTYTVPAGTYTSYSQADADQQAYNDVVLNGQNYANNNAPCNQVWYNTVQSGDFTRNNCGGGSTGSTVTYTVAANTYMSYISPADAQQKAINDVNANGQAYANANGTCSTQGCTATIASGLYPIASGASTSNGTTTFYMVFNVNGGSVSLNSNIIIGQINGECRPSVARYVTVNTDGRTWLLTIYASGQVEARLVNGPNVNPGTTVAFTNVQYNL